MNLSDYTMEVLDNFSSINPGMMFPKGSVIKTMSPQRTMFAIAKVEEDFPMEACVYDMKRFLSTVQLFENPDIQFDTNNFSISSKGSEVKYTYCAKNMIHVPPDDKRLQLPSVEVEFKLKWEDIQRLMKASGVLQLNEVVFWSDNGSIFVGVDDTSDSTSDTFRYKVDEYDGEEFRVVVLSENLKLLKADYDVSVCTRGMIQLESENVTYFISCEAK